MTPEETQTEFRKIIVDRGIVTEKQATAVKFWAVRGEEFPDVPRCPCEKCKASHNFMAFAINERGLSSSQVTRIIEVFNEYCAPFIPASQDLSKWRRVQ